MKNTKHFWLITVILLGFSSLAATAQTEKSALLNKSDSLYAAAFNLYKTGKYTEAIPKYIFVNKLNEHIPEVHLNLGHCYFITEKLTHICV